MAEEIPKKGIAGVVVNEGSDFRVEVQELDVPVPSECEQEACAVTVADPWQGTMSSSSA